MLYYSSRKIGLVQHRLSWRACLPARGEAWRGEAILFVGIFGRDTSFFETVARIMRRKFGHIHSRSELFDFTHTDYYMEEMGENLKKMFFVFEKPIYPGQLADIKRYTGKLEAKFSQKEEGLTRRRVNLDPGYLSLNKVVLASTKDYSHRLYLGKGIYGEVTLFFKNKTFTPFPWTYPDYKTPGYVNFFNEMRKICYNRNK